MRTQSRYNQITHSAKYYYMRSHDIGWARQATLYELGSVPPEVMAHEQVLKGILPLNVLSGIPQWVIFELLDYWL